MLDAGVSINNALNILSNQVSNKRLKATLAEVEEPVEKGEMLSQSMGKYSTVFPKLLISMIKSGEVSGNLDEVMLRMSVHFEKETKMNNKIKTAMTYPTILSIVAVSTVMFIMTFVMPTFIEMFETEDIQLPLATKILMGISGLLSNNIMLIIIAIILLLIAFNFYKKTKNGLIRLSKIKLKIPIIGNLNKK